MAAGLKRDTIVILRMDGEDLREFVNSPCFEAELLPMFSHIESSDASLRDHLVKALGKLSVDQGMPPTSDSWVVSKLVDPAVESCLKSIEGDRPLTQETCLEEFKRVAEILALRLKEQPVIVAHSENTFDGSGIKRFLSNKFELDKALNTALETVPRDRHGKFSKHYLRVVLDSVALSAALPPLGAVEEMDNVIAETLKIVKADDGKLVKEDDFRKLIAEILGNTMRHLEGNPITVSSNTVVHEPLATPSSFLPPSP